MQPHACLQTQQQCCGLLGVVLQGPRQRSQHLVGVDGWDQAADQHRPAQENQQANSGADQRSVGPDGAVGNESSVGPPDDAQWAPAMQSIGLRVEVWRKPQSAEQERGEGDAACGWAKQRSRRQADGKAPTEGGAVVVLARSQGSPICNRVQIAALRQNLHFGRLAQR